MKSQKPDLNNPRRFYFVACPYCQAVVGRACVELRRLERDGTKVWSVPHMARVRLAEQTSRPQNSGLMHRILD